MLSPELAERSSQKNRIIPDGMRMMTARPERQKYDQILMTKLEGIIEWQMIPRLCLPHSRLGFRFSVSIRTCFPDPGCRRICHCGTKSNSEVCPVLFGRA